MTYQEIYEAWKDFRTGKKTTNSINKFEYYLEQNLHRLTQDINTRAYQHGKYRKLTIQEKKRRDLAVAPVADRVIHRYVYDELVEICDKSFDPDVWSCRKGKGLHAALSRTQELLCKYQDSYIWRADISKFFDNVNHSVLRNCLLKKLNEDSELYYLCQEILQSYNLSASQPASQPASHIGIPIGNLTSQIFANIYMNEFDRYVRHTLKPLAYLRYGDDFIIFAKTRRKACYFKEEAKEFLQNELRLRLHKSNDVVVSVKAGLHFLGHVININYCVVDKRTSKTSLQKVDASNVSSYQSLRLIQSVKTNLLWSLFKKIDEIIDE